MEKLQRRIEVIKKFRDGETHLRNVALGLHRTLVQEQSSDYLTSPEYAFMTDLEGSITHGISDWSDDGWRKGSLS